MLVYLWVIDTLSISSVSTVSLVVLGLVLFTMKCEDTNIHNSTIFNMDTIIGSILVVIPVIVVKMYWVNGNDHYHHYYHHHYYHHHYHHYH